MVRIQRIWMNFEISEEDECMMHLLKWGGWFRLDADRLIDYHRLFASSEGCFWFLDAGFVQVWIESKQPLSSLSWNNGPGSIYASRRIRSSTPDPRRDCARALWAHNQVRSTTCEVFVTANYRVEYEQLKRNIMSYFRIGLSIRLGVWIFKLSCKPSKTWGDLESILIWQK